MVAAEQNVGHGHVLEDAALHAPGQQPQLGHHFGPVAGEDLIAGALGEAADDAVDEAVLAAVESEAAEK